MKINDILLYLEMDQPYSDYSEIHLNPIKVIEINEEEESFLAIDTTGSIYELGLDDDIVNRNLESFLKEVEELKKVKRKHE